MFTDKINPKTIKDSWEDIQRVAETVYSGRTRASVVIRKISSFSRKQSLFKALRNLGRLYKTRHILQMAGDLNYRRRTHQGLNKGESRNALAKDMIYARRGSLRDRTPYLLLNRDSTLNLAILCLAIWNTVHMQRGIRSLKRNGHTVNEDNSRFLSPFSQDHVNFYGQFHFQPVPDLDPLSAKKEFESI